MGQRGPAPRSIEEHKRLGTHRPERNAATPLVIGGRTLPKPAPYLTPGQKKQFRRITKLLAQGNLLDAADAGVVELTAIEVDKLVVANAHLADSLTLEITKKGRDNTTWTETVMSPYLKVRDSAVQQLRYLYRELGIGPSARAALANAGVSGKPPAKGLPGVGAEPTPLHAIPGGKATEQGGT